MPGKINIDINKIKSQVSKQLNQIATQAGQKIQQAYKSSVSQFYGSWQPSMYLRTYSLFTGSSAYNGRPTHQKLGEMRYSCGIVASPSYYQGNPYSSSSTMGVTPQLVWDSAFMSGIHGVIGGRIAAVTESPQSVMQGKFSQIKGQVQSALGNLTITL